MIPLEQAVEILEGLVSPPEGEELVPLSQARGRILSRDMAAPLDNPPFDRSPLDGYALRGADLAGASQIFRGGVVSYVNDVKAQVLGVPQETLDAYGAVSEPVARAMAEGCRKLCGSDIAVSVTGLAGPEGDDRGNEVGTVYIALADSEGTICRKFSCGMGRGRGKVRSSAAQNAFDMLRRRLLGLPL